VIRNVVRPVSSSERREQRLVAPTSIGESRNELAAGPVFEPAVELYDADDYLRDPTAIDSADARLGDGVPPSMRCGRPRWSSSTAT
jgi:hypothetical protein